MMDMVKTNIACEPLQHFRQFIEGAAIHPGIEELPLLVAFPVGRLEIMLNVEKPDTRPTGKQQDGDFDQQESLPANFEHEPANDRRKRYVGPDHAAFFALPGSFLKETMGNGKDDRCA